jgi:hypothetical protein
LGAGFLRPSEDGGLLLFLLLAFNCAVSSRILSSRATIFAACASMIASRLAIQYPNIPVSIRAINHKLALYLHSANTLVLLMH